MKKIVLIVFCLAIFNKINGQKNESLKKGDFTLGLSLQYNYKSTIKKSNGITNENFSEPSLTFAPQLHYALSDKFLLGAKVDIYKQTNTEAIAGEDTQQSKQSVNSYFLSARYLPINKNRYYVNLDLDAGIVTSSRSSKDVVNSFATNGGRASLSIGAGYFITRKFALTIGLNDIVKYDNYTLTNNDNSQTTKTKFESNIGNIQSIFMVDKFGLLYKF